MPNAGNYVWVLLPLVFIISWRLKWLYRLTFIYVSLMCLVAAFIPEWHLIFKPFGVNGGALSPILRGECIVFYCLFLNFCLLLSVKIPSLSRWTEWLGWIIFAVLLFYGGGGLIPIFTNPSLAAVAAILCLGFSKRNNLLAGLACCLLTFSRAGILAWGIGFALTYWWLWFQASRRIAILAWSATLALLGCGVYYIAHETAQRDLMWSRFWDIYADAGWVTRALGTGPGTFSTWYENEQGAMLKYGTALIEQFHHVHNDYLEALGDFGIIGIGLIAASLFYAVRRAAFTQLIPLAILAGVMLIYFPLHYPTTLLLGMVFLKRAVDSSERAKG